MKFSINRDRLLLPLQQMIGVIERKQTLPILANLLLTIDDDRLVLTGTDLEIQLVTRCSVDVDQPGAITAPARKLMDICRLLPEGSRIAVELDKERLRVHSGRSRFSLATLPAANFPEFSGREYDARFSIEANRLKKTLGKTQFCIALLDVRQALNGLLLDIGREHLTAVGADGHRLALYKESLNDTGGSGRQLIVPRKSVLELYRLLGDSDQTVDVHIASNSMRLEIEEIVFSTKLLEGKYPDFKRTVPTNISRTIQVGREVYREALNRAAILANETFKAIRLDVAPGLMKISAHNPEREAAEEEVPILYDGESFSIGFNAAYMVDAVSNLDSDHIRLSFSDTHSCCLVDDPQEENLKYIVMPIHL